MRYYGTQFGKHDTLTLWGFKVGVVLYKETRDVGFLISHCVSYFKRKGNNERRLNLYDIPCFNLATFPVITRILNQKVCVVSQKLHVKFSSIGLSLYPFVWYRLNLFWIPAKYLWFFIGSQCWGLQLLLCICSTMFGCTIRHTFYRFSICTERSRLECLLLAEVLGRAWRQWRMLCSNLSLSSHTMTKKMRRFWQRIWRKPSLWWKFGLPLKISH